MTRNLNCGETGRSRSSASPYMEHQLQHIRKGDDMIAKRLSQSYCHVLRRRDFSNQKLHRYCLRAFLSCIQVGLESEQKADSTSSQAVASSAEEQAREQGQKKGQQRVSWWQSFRSV